VLSRLQDNCTAWTATTKLQVKNGERGKTAEPGTATNQKVGLTPIDGVLDEY